jgi:hypothetical protein
LLKVKENRHYFQQKTAFFTDFSEDFSGFRDAGPPGLPFQNIGEIPAGVPGKEG